MNPAEAKSALAAHRDSCPHCLADHMDCLEAEQLAAKVFVGPVWERFRVDKYPGHILAIRFVEKAAA